VKGLILVFFGRRLRATLHWDGRVGIATFLGVVFRHNIFIVETQSLAIVLACVEVHLRLDLKHEIPLVTTKELRSIVVFLCIEI